jgi:hypothetical protein
MTPASAEKLKAVAKQGGVALLTIIPRVVLGGLLGAISGLLMMAAIGVGLAGATMLIWKVTGFSAPTWLTASLAVTPLVLGLAGGYTGAVRGLLQGLGQQLIDRKLIAYLYAQVKPACISAARKLAGAKGSSAGEVAGEVRAQLEQGFKDEAATEKPAGFGDKVARFLAAHSRRMLALSIVGHVARAKSGAEAVAELEQMGLQKLEAIVVGSLEDLFSLKLTLISGAALLICALPQAIYFLTS